MKERMKEGRRKRKRLSHFFLPDAQVLPGWTLKVLLVKKRKKKNEGRRDEGKKRKR